MKDKLKEIKSKWLNEKSTLENLLSDPKTGTIPSQLIKRELNPILAFLDDLEKLNGEDLKRVEISCDTCKHLDAPVGKTPCNMCVNNHSHWEQDVT